MKTKTPAAEQRRRFRLLVEVLRRAKYTVKVSKDSYGYFFARVTGKNIWGLFSVKTRCKGLCRYANLNGRICADHQKCYDKPQKCPLVMKLPQSIEKADLIVSWLTMLGTPYGFSVSNSYDYIDDNPFPFQVRGA